MPDEQRKLGIAGNIRDVEIEQVAGNGRPVRKVLVLGYFSDGVRLRSRHSSGRLGQLGTDLLEGFGHNLAAAC